VSERLADNHFFEELLSVPYVVYGLRVAANIALPGLPVRPDSDAFDVRIHLKDWTTFPATFRESVEIFDTSSDDTADGQPNLRVGLLSGGDYFAFFYSDGVHFAVERRGRDVWGDWPQNYTLEDACTYLLGPVLGFVLRLRGVTCLHASAVAVGEHAIALVGFPGAGKSTTAAAFAICGFSVISDDLAALADEGEDFSIQPGYPRVNLWPDSVRILFGSAEALPRITPAWNKHYVALGTNDLGFATKPLPLGAIYLLGEREEALAAPIIEEMVGGDALAALVANTYLNYLLDRGMRSQEFDVLGRVVTGIPIRRVRTPADSSAVFDLCRAIAADSRQLTVASSASATLRHR
jgi:hypothetical protein